MSLAPKLHNAAGMDQLTATAASGMRSRIESLDLLANMENLDRVAALSDVLAAGCAGASQSGAPAALARAS